MRISRLYARLYADAALVTRLNGVYPKRGVIKTRTLMTGATGALQRSNCCGCDDKAA